MVHSGMQAFKGNQSAAKLATARHVALNSTSYLFINSLVMCNSQTNPNSDSDSVVKVVSSSQQQPSKHTGQWLKYGSFVLSRKDQQDLLGDKQLNDVYTCWCFSIYFKVKISSHCRATRHYYATNAKPSHLPPRGPDVATNSAC